MSTKLAVLKDGKTNETRAAASPETVKNLSHWDVASPLRPMLVKKLVSLIKSTRRRERW